MVPTRPGKRSWDFSSKIFRNWKVLENEFDPGNYKALKIPGIVFGSN